MFTFDTTYLSLPSVFYKLQKPTPVRAARLAVVNEALAAELGLHLGEWPTETQADMFAGNLLPQGATPFAQAYAGHGLNATHLAGKLLAQAIAGEDDSDFQLFNRVPHITFPGGKLLRSPLLALGMSWYRLREYLRR